MVVLTPLEGWDGHWGGWTGWSSIGVRMAGLVVWALIGGKQFSACSCAVFDSTVVNGWVECGDSGSTLVSTWRGRTAGEANGTRAVTGPCVAGDSSVVFEQQPLRKGRQLLHCLFYLTHTQFLHLPPALQREQVTVLGHQHPVERVMEKK